MISFQQVVTEYNMAQRLAALGYAVIPCLGYGRAIKGGLSSWFAVFDHEPGLRTDADLQRTLEAVTAVNAQILGLPAGRIEVGAPADLVVAEAENASEAVAAHPPRIVVLRAGRVVRPPERVTAG